jgi:LuxR family maltose regulon positive regulatory protein
MPKPATHILRWSEEQQSYELSIDQRPQQHFGLEDGQAWLTFLETHSSFSFQGREGHLSVIKETRRHATGYWYAYRSSGRRTLKRYLGQDSNVTLAHLEEVASALARASRSMRPVQTKEEIAISPSPSASLLLSKLLPPRLASSLVERPRLLARLDAALEGKLTLLVAPAGFGKTTVISQWTKERRTSARSKLVAWLSLDSADNDLFRFWHYVIAACQTFQKQLGQAALTILSEAMQPPYNPPPLETALTLLLNDLAQGVHNGLLVLDDYHVIEEPAIHRTLTFFLDHLPPTLSVLLLTRTEPGQLPLLRWRARGDLSELHAADLRFSAEETASFVQRAFPTSLSETALHLLDTSLQGWVAGLRLLALTGSEQVTTQSIEHTLASLHQHPDSSYQPLLDYFVTEILNAQPEALQHFLLQTSVLSRLNAPLCNAITDRGDSGTLLKNAMEAGLFLEALGGTEGWYRFHSLFAEALHREAGRRLGQVALQALSLGASHWYEQHMLIEDAIEMALQAHDFERVALLIERVDMDGEISDLYTVRRWLEAMPETILRAHSMLCWLAALALQMSQEEQAISAADRERVEELLHMAERGWRNEDQPDNLGLVAVFRAMSAWRSVQFAQAMEYAQQALATLPTDEQGRHFQTWRGICLFIAGTGLMYDGRFAEARSSFLEAHAYSLAAGYQRLTRGLIVLIGACSYLLGELHQAHEYYQQALSAARQQEDREILARALLGLATITFEWNELERSEQQVNEALALISKEQANLRNEAALQLAHLAHARGQLTAAQQQLAMLLARLQTATTSEATVRLPDALMFSARLALEAGDLQNATHLLQSLEIEEQMEARLLQARLLLVQGKAGEALLGLEQLLHIAQGWRQAIEIRILLALTHTTRQEGQQARQWLLQALSQTRSEGLMRIFLSEGEPLAHLLRQLIPSIHEKALRSYARSILHAFTQVREEMAPGPASSEYQLVEPLSPQELRVLRLLVAGRSNAEIAQELIVSVNTVKDHVRHLYRKLGVNNRLQASEMARHLKIL